MLNHIPMFLFLDLTIVRTRSVTTVFPQLSNRSRNDIKRTFGHLRPAKIQISLRIRAVRPESSLGAFWIVKFSKLLHADNEDSYAQVDLSPLGAHVRRYVFSRYGSYIKSDIWACAWQNLQNGLCAQRRLRSAWASAQSDQSLCCALLGSLRIQSFRRSVFIGRTYHFVGFVMRWLISSSLLSNQKSSDGGRQTKKVTYQVAFITKYNHKIRTWS